MINNVFGKVYDIRVMYTHVSELNSDGDSTGKAILIPNEFIFTHAIINYTKGTGFIWDSIAVHLTYKSDWKKSIKTIERIVQDYYDKNIKKEVESTFKGSFKGYEKIKARIVAHERGITIKVRYLVSFEKANDIKDELMMIILEKLKKEEVVFGKVENVS
ncbi:MAG: hypothetical protein KatS3mg001_319 [Candidatus Pacearchaeota archaeon]|nr:MAG: hypothetical protein KatS3mg001_319 [Candidatus Pacearchaeota archaeon]